MGGNVVCGGVDATDVSGEKDAVDTMTKVVTEIKLVADGLTFVRVASWTMEVTPPPAHVGSPTADKRSLCGRLKG